jgi:hypothetical protein
MKEPKLAEYLEFLVDRQGQDEAAILAQALRTGIEALYREALVEEYLLGRVPRETVLREFGPERVEEIEYRRDALRRDVTWGLQGA